MGSIIINKVKYSGEKYYFESPRLHKGLNIIEGPNGTGKSTFINFIYFIFGGKVEEFSNSNNETHFEIKSDKNNFVEVELTINGKDYLLKRFFNSNDITVIEIEGSVFVYPISRSKTEKYIFSDWILEKIEINVVEIYQGISNFKINIKDLFRLIYHNQEPNPRKIYKPGDSDNFISDSELVRKVIFELLVGKTFSLYYETLAKFKEEEKNRNIKKALHDEYILISKNLAANKEDLNLIFLKQVKDEKDQQLSKLYQYRDSVKIQKEDNGFSFKKVSILKSDMFDFETELNEVKHNIGGVNNELSKLIRLKENIILEVTQIKKIVHTHERLNLFSADTCPYCLRDVDRKKGHCVCGNEVDENQYERFFYKPDEYIDILKSKQKSVETINQAISSCLLDKEKDESRIKTINERINHLKDEIKKYINGLGNNSNISKLNEVDDLILSVREELNSLNQRIEIETKRNLLQSEYEIAEGKVTALRAKVRLLETQSAIDMNVKISNFNQIYNTLMISTLKKCRAAKISNDDYMPIIGDGEYREASASVPIRLMYYFSLLYLALNEEDVKFPKFLLIDTPETAGVDPQNLMNCLSQINIITKDKEDYQIILSTGIEKYPSDFSDKVFLKLSDTDKLLKPVIIIDNLSVK